MKLNPPLLTIGPLSGSVYIVTHGKVEPHPTREGETMVTASVKYDITEQFMRFVRSLDGSEPASAVVAAWDAYLSDPDEESIATWCALRDAIDALRGRR